MKGALLIAALWSAVALFGANSCLKCHNGIEDIRDPHSEMMRKIEEVAAKAGHPGNDCIVCHGGNPDSVIKARAHQGTAAYFLEHNGPKAFYAAPSAPGVNAETCGMCHPQQVGVQQRSLMQTQSGRIHEAEWGFGLSADRNHTRAAYAVSNPDDSHARLGTETYRAYMERLAVSEPQAFPKEHSPIPSSLTEDALEQNVSLSVYTYLRRTYLSGRNSAKAEMPENTARGSGCAACHIPYGSGGHYEGGDPAIDRTAAGYMAVHAIQSTREAKVTVGNETYSGVPVETCAVCHDRGKHTALSYQGLMEAAEQPSGDGNGSGARAWDTKRYRHMQSDVHFQKGMLCQDCHTSGDLHGDGFLSGADLGAVEIECQDCHGTTKAYPWELPLGYGDEFGAAHDGEKARGVTRSIAEYLKQGAVGSAGEVFLLSSRGNPLVHTEKRRNRIVVHLASGRDVTLVPLKALKAEGKLSAQALTAMDAVDAHTQKMECYACHTLWAPQYYGMQVTIDYSKAVQTAMRPTGLQGPDANTTETNETVPLLADGAVTQTHAYLRWENPPLSVNGEGRVAPTAPEFQANLTVIGRDGKTITGNTLPASAATMAPLQPHTVSKRSRSCENCHTDPKAAGYGTEHGRLHAAAWKAWFEKDWERFVDENGTRLQTVGTHWKHSAPLSAEQRDRLDRSGVCFSCHQSIPGGDLAVDAMAHIGQFAGIKNDNKLHQGLLNGSMRIGAWVQVIVGTVVLFVTLYLLKIIFFGSRKKTRRWK